MKSGHRKKALDLFEAALGREPGERARFLAEACAEDSELRAQVEKLITAHQEKATVLQETLVEGSPPAPDPDAPAEGRLIGPYRIIGQLGEGGMGAVYLAARDDAEYHKRVAIKVIRPGMNAQIVVRRFLSERQILASLDHPNIARLLDGGTTEDGRPYFVMDYIEGVPITSYCERQKLSIAERLKLFRQVCSAVSYAHRNLIIHRDLKPGNILVTADGAPRLLDFGIAKLLNPELSGQTDITVLGHAPMTIDYASPEQVRGDAITTASDVYSLGVMLYELLTGRRPYTFKNRVPREIERVICEEEPARPSTSIEKSDTSRGLFGKTQVIAAQREAEKSQMRRELVGDLDNIVLMAMRKEPQRRYSSVEQLSEDIRRYLEGRPVIATRDTFSYRAGKFIRRNRVAVLAAALTILALIAGIAATLWQARAASIERARAERRFNDVRQLANSFLFEFHDSIRDLPGSTPARELVVARAVEYLDSLARESSDDLSLQRELAAAYERVGDIQGYPYNPNIGDARGAMESYKKSLAIREALYKADSSADLRRGLAASLERTGTMISWQTGNINESLAFYDRAREIRESVAAETNSVEDRRELAGIHEITGDAQKKNRDAASALESYRRAMTIRESIAAIDPTSDIVSRDLAISHSKIAEMLALTGDTQSAMASQRKALAIFETLARRDATNAKARREVAFAYNKLGDLLWYSDDVRGAIEQYEKAREIRLSIVAFDPTNAQARRDLAMSEAGLGDTLIRKGDIAGGRELIKRALATFEELAARSPTDAEARRDLAIGYQTMGETLSSAADERRAAKKLWSEAREWYQRSLDVFLDLQRRGVMREADARIIEEIRREIARCDAEIPKMPR
jgi:serine/threonine protein kinase/Flp pilus assembly protein TadD